MKKYCGNCEQYKDDSLGLCENCKGMKVSEIEFQQKLFDDLCDFLDDHINRIGNLKFSSKDAQIVVSLISKLESWATDNNIPTDHTHTGYTKLTDIQAMVATLLKTEKEK